MTSLRTYREEGNILLTLLNDFTAPRGANTQMAFLVLYSMIHDGYAYMGFMASYFGFWRSFGIAILPCYILVVACANGIAF